ncbi:hypothetical protein J7I94_21420 [Streptomyces sp. ISL-12]|nr:hypothetical protein [Streptomyces sp. ISL-12]
MGDAAVTRLREIRAHGPGNLRRVALRLLADLRGEEGFIPADRRALDRLVRLKLRSERPVTLPPDSHWLAFPADGLAGVVSALTLHDLRPVTTVMGLSAAEGASARDAVEVTVAPGRQETAHRVFITPQFGAWRLLYGNSYLDAYSGERIAQTVSATCGEAHFYRVDVYHDLHAWCVARDGDVIRRHSGGTPATWHGDPLPFELDYIEGRAWIDPSQCGPLGVTDANVAAHHLSVDVGYMPADITQEHGWLATTHPEAPNSRFPGALPV